jgi:hypothetical protein
MEEMRKAAELFGAGHWKESQALCEAILARDPRHFYALHLLSALAARRGEWEECVRLATRALAVDPDHVEVLGNRGAALRMLDRYDEALADYERAMALAPGAADILNNRGVALAALNRHGEALASYDRALALKPEYARARFNRALSHLVMGDFARGWPDHEARWTGSDTQGTARSFPQPPLTDLAAVRGKTVLLHAEQGLGDMIQYVRYVPLLKARGATVILEVHGPLKEMMSGVEGVDRAFALEENLPPFDFHCAVVSLPLVFATRLDSIPARVPYLRALPEYVERWRARLGEPTRPRVGLAWSGSTTLRNDRHRSISLTRLAPLLREDCTFVALQKDIRAADREALEGSGMLHFEDELADFRDTAALASLLDVVVSVDTSIAHLAGALGKPLWLLLPFSPDWRWLLDREDSPWYPTASLFRQPRIGDWDSVVSRVASRVRGLARTASGALE